MSIDFLRELLLSSGEILRKGFGQIKGIETKQDQSNVVTEFDYQSESHIRNAITQAYPSHNILGEEHGYEDKKSAYTWIIDPLDGTSNFAANLPWFGVLIALLKDNQPAIAGAYLPMSDELYLAEKNKGAFKNDRKISVSQETSLSNLLCCYSMDFSIDIQKTEKEVQVIKELVQSCRNLRSTNSLLDFCYVADGRLGAAINQSMKVWDIAACELILGEAGAKVTDVKGEAITYAPSDQSVTQNYTAVAAHPEIHARVMQIMTGN